MAADHGKLTRNIVLAIVLAIMFAFLAPALNVNETFLKGLLEWLSMGGEIFLNLLKMMVVPLVVTSVMSGILGLGDIRKLGKPGGYAILYYLSTTVLAVLVGLVIVNLIRPGVGTISPEEKEATSRSPGKTEIREKIRDTLAKEAGLSKKEVASAFEELPAPDTEQNTFTMLKHLVMQLFTDNLFDSAVNADLLPLIVFSIIFAGMLTTMGERVENITRLVEQINHALMQFVLLLMKVAPLGIFCLIAARFGRENLKGELISEFQRIGWYMATVLLGLAFHAFVTLSLIFWYFTKRNPYRFMYQMSKALLTAFSTASSSATLPVTMETAVKNAKVSEESTEFVLPLGATINMDGTALYEAAAAIFIAQVMAKDLTLTEQMIVAITATMAAIGAAGIPEAGLVTMLIVLNAVKLETKYMGLILSVDWLLDRFRTTVNVFGDACGAAVIQDTFPKSDNNST